MRNTFGLNPSESFTVKITDISRSEIADYLSNYIHDRHCGIVAYRKSVGDCESVEDLVFVPDDDRLDDLVCKQFASKMGKFPEPVSSSGDMNNVLRALEVLEDRLCYDTLLLIGFPKEMLDYRVRSSRSDACFALQSITRSGIADDLNSYLESLDIEDIVKADDPLLTDLVCTLYASALGDIESRFAQDDDRTELEAKLCHETLVNIGLDPDLLESAGG